MCGIAGAVGRLDAVRLVHDGLRTLEYRGYDSCGIAWQDDGGLGVQRAVGPVDALPVPDVESPAALGHTRWATHGGVTVENAHPHVDCARTSAVVHNGIILNHSALRDRLEAEGHRFASATDSECLAHLWESYAALDPMDRLARTMEVLDGTYSVAILDVPTGSLYVAKHRNPLWLAKGGQAVLLASDPLALRRHAEQAVCLEDGDHGRLDADGWTLHDVAGRPVERSAVSIAELDGRSDKAGHEHFMLKEIHEAPMVLNRVLSSHVRQVPPYFDVLPVPTLRRMRRLLALGAGTSFHAGLLGAGAMQRMAGIPATVRPTPEYKDEADTPERGTVVAALSQSGETLDTLQALHRLRSHPVPVVAFTNSPASSIGRMSEHVVPLEAGIEVSVAATKTFLSQALLMHLMALQKGRLDRVLDDGAAAHAARNLLRLPRAIDRTIRQQPALQDLARRLAGFDNVFVLAKGPLHPVALEAALKLKEIAYQHAEAYPAGELKHGPFALLTDRTAVLFLVPDGPQEASLRNSRSEVAARGAPVFTLAVSGSDLADAVLLPRVDVDLQPFVFAQAVHLLAYWVAKARGLPIDRPRNLAKSVTVE